MATMNDVIQRHMLPNRRWERSSPNPELTHEIDALARRILALPPDSPAVWQAHFTILPPKPAPP